MNNYDYSVVVHMRWYKSTERCSTRRVAVKAGLWTLDWTVDWILDRILDRNLDRALCFDNRHS